MLASSDPCFRSHSRYSPGYKGKLCRLHVSKKDNNVRGKRTPELVDAEGSDAYDRRKDEIGACGKAGRHARPFPRSWHSSTVLNHSFYIISLKHIL